MSCVTLTKSRKLACTSKIAGVVAGVAKYDSLNRVATTATGVMFYRGGMY
jgi:phage shock protein PspC (stress-responsive transcriptional regulator)